jgi:hypothetical protein
MAAETRLVRRVSWRRGVETELKAGKTVILRQKLRDRQPGQIRETGLGDRNRRQGILGLVGQGRCMRQFAEMRSD